MDALKQRLDAHMLGLFAKKPRSGKRRRFERISGGNSMIVINDVSYAVVEWSLDGFRALGYGGGLDRKEEVRARLVIAHGGGPTGFNATVRILRADEASGEIAGEFSEMEEKARKTFERIYEDKVSRLEASQEQRRRA